MREDSRQPAGEDGRPEAGKAGYALERTACQSPGVGGGAVSTAQNPITAAAWADFIMWCEEQTETIAAFNAETGRAYMKPKPPIEAMIDDATGKAQDDAFAFGPVGY